MARSRSTSSPRSTSSSRRSVSTSCTAAIARIRFTESSSAFDASVPGARAWRRRSDATVWRLFLTRWWISWAMTPRMTARPCSSATAAWFAIDASSLLSSVVKGVSRSQTSSPIWRPFQRSGSRTACRPADPLGPRDLAVLEHERGARRTDGVHRRSDDRAERFLEVERLRDGLRDPGQRLELRTRAAGRARRASRSRSPARPGPRWPSGARSRPARTRAAPRFGRSARPRGAPWPGWARPGSTGTAPPAGSEMP